MKLVKKNDILLIVVLIVIITCFFIFETFSSNNSDNKIAVIKVNGENYKEINLNTEKDQSFIISNNFKSKITIKNSEIRFEHSECSDLVCVKTGWLSKNNDIAVCIPNKISIKVLTKKTTQNQIDEVAR